MPRYEKTVPVSNLAPENILAVCYSCFQQLNWNIRYATEDRLVAFTPSSSFSKSMEVMATVTPEGLVVSSEMIHDEMIDLRKKNQKNVESFLSLYEQTGSSLLPETIEANKNVIQQLIVETTLAAEQEIKELNELNESMNLGTGNVFVTYAIIAINIVVFILMVIQGAGIIDANGLVHISWGSNFGPLTMSGDWWRLFTAMFLHFGIIHLLLNMYALFSIAAYLEPMLGKTRYITAYVCTGILASLVSLWWHSTPANSAGASGAVFGMYGVFLALLTTNLIPKTVRKALLQSIVIFVIFNLAYGLKGGIDNAAHIGGLLSGLGIGFLFAFNLKKEKQGQKAAWVVPVVVLASILLCGFYLQQNKSSQEERRSVLSEVRNAGYPDSERFNELYNQFVTLQDEALQVFNEYGENPSVLADQLLEKAAPKWNQADNVADKLLKLNVSEEMKQKASVVKKYISLRRKEMELEIKKVKEPASEAAAYQEQIQVRQEIEQEVAKLK
jgi:rhomboid protease GluP